MGFQKIIYINLGLHLSSQILLFLIIYTSFNLFSHMVIQLYWNFYWMFLMMTVFIYHSLSF